jgi:hypothetical protein
MSALSPFSGANFADFSETASYESISANEMARIVASTDEPLETICFVLGSTGMRIGRVLALRTDDLDFERNLIQVRHSVFAGTLGSPKSGASMASLPMPFDLAFVSRHFWLRSTTARIAKVFYTRIAKGVHSLRTSCGKRSFARCSLRWGFYWRASMRSAMCRYRSDRLRRKHYDSRRSATTQRSKNHSRTVCARRCDSP